MSPKNYDEELPEPVSGQKSDHKPTLDREDEETATAHEPLDPQMIAFLETYLLSDEWFQVFNGEGLALRRLKGHSIDPERGVVYFANRNGCD